MFYERLLADFDSELLKLLGYLEISLSEDDRQRIKEETSFQTMRRESPNHVQKGKSSGWTAALTESQKVMTQRTAGKMLKLLNYRLAEGDDVDSVLPELPDSINPSEIDEAVACSRRGPVGEVVRVIGFLLSDRSFRIKWNRIREWSTGKAVVQG